MKNFDAQEADRITGISRLNPDYYDKQKFPFLKMPYAFKLCEGGPGESTAIVLEAFSKLPQYTVVVMCNWNYSEHGVWLRKIYSSFTNIIMLDAAYSLRETVLLRANCFLYIHGEKSGPANTALLEAMYSALPVVAFAEPANKTTTGNKACYFENSEGLKNIILQKTITDFKKMGADMQAIAAGCINPSVYTDANNPLLLN